MTEMKSILVVDDNVTFATTTCMILERYGYRTEKVSTGKEAIERVHSQPFDLILMDYKMQGMNGVQTIKEILKIRPNSAVIFITAYETSELEDETRDIPVFGIIHKPFNMNELLMKINGIWGNRITS